MIYLFRPFFTSTYVTGRIPYFETGILQLGCKLFNQRLIFVRMADKHFHGKIAFLFRS